MKRFNVFTYQTDYSIKIIGEYLNKSEAMELFWNHREINDDKGNPDRSEIVGICEVTLKEKRKLKLKKINEV